MKMEIDLGAWMWNLKHIKECGLFDLFISIKIGLKTRENLFFCGGKKLGIVECGVQYDIGTKDQLPFLCGVIKKVRFHPKGENLWNAFQSASQRYKRCITSIFIHCAINPNCLLDEIEQAVKSLVINGK